MSQQGKALSIGQKLSIINLKKSFDAERKMGPTVPTKDPVGRVSRSLNVGIRTVEKILSDYNKNDQTLVELPQKSRGKPLKKSASEVENERNTTVIENGLCQIGVIQIASKRVRSIRTYVETNQNIRMGERIGMITFGSQTDIILPADTTVKIKKGQWVCGGKTVIASLDDR